MVVKPKKHRRRRAKTGFSLSSWSSSSWRFWALLLLLAMGAGFGTGALFMTPRRDDTVPIVAALSLPHPTADSLRETGEALSDPLLMREEAARRVLRQPLPDDPTHKPAPDPYADLLPFAPGEGEPDRPGVPPSPVGAASSITMSAKPVPADRGIEHGVDHRRAVLNAGGVPPMIAVVIDDLGIDRPHAAEVIDLPGPLTLSFMTYADDLAAQTARGRAHGHEIMLHVPMEPQARRVDPGPFALMTGLDPAELRRRLSWGLNRVEGIVGINNHMGSRFTESYDGMHLVMEMLQERHLFFLDSKTTANSAGIAAAQAVGIPHAARDVFLDVTISTPAVAAELAKAEAIARRTGYAIAIGHPHGPTISELRHWLPDMAARGFQLVPVSTIIARTRDPGAP